MSQAPRLTSAKPRILRPWQTAGLVLAVIGSAAIFYSHTRTHAEVLVTHPVIEDIASTVSTTGEVVPVNDFPARANFSGLVDRIYVKLGQHVHPGQNLLRMKDQYAVPRLEKAKAALDAAQINLQNMEHSGSSQERITSHADLVKAQTEQAQAANALATARELLKKGDVSEAEVDAAQQRLEIAKANARALQQKLTNRYSPEDIASFKQRIAADKADVAAEKVSYANANITSPIAGTVYLLPVKLWDFVPAGADLLHVANLKKIHIDAEFDAPDVGKLRVGEPVNITWDGAPGRIWHGHIQDKPLAVARAGARSVGQCFIDIDDDDGALPVNTSVAVVATVQKHQHVLTIPRESVYFDGLSRYVYRVQGDSLRKTPVETGLANPMRIEITRGLTSQDQVVLHAVEDQKLKNGLKVTIAQ